MPKTASELMPIFSSPVAINAATDDAMLQGIKQQFPIETGKYTLSVEDMHVDKKHYTTADEKDAILKSRSLTYPIRGTLMLHDRSTGKLVDRVQNFALADTFHVTNKHTLLYKGNNYSVANLMQLRPGVYTRKTNNGELETNINTGKGATFSLGLDSKTMEIYFSKINGKNLHIPIAPLMTKGFGLSDADVMRFVPSDVWMANRKITKGKEDLILGQLYKRLVDRKEQSRTVSTEEMGVALKSRLAEMTLDKETTATTLGKSFGGIEPETLLRAMKNIVEVYSKKRPEDNRDSLQFKRVQNLPDFIGRRFEANKLHQTVGKSFDRIKYNLSRLNDAAPNLREVIPAKPFNKIYSDFIIGSQLSSTPDETNPVESIENVGKVTLIAAGDGGMSSERQATTESRNVHPSQLGIIDPSRTPESSTAGLDQRFTITAHRDKEGGMYARAVDNQGKKVYLSANEIMTHTIGFPGEKDNGKPIVQAQVHGEFKNVPRGQVQYWIPSGTDMYTITTNLVPFLNTNHPGRLTMAGKAIPQALSLTNRETPLVQTVADNGETFVSAIGKIVSTVAPVSGTVVKSTPSQMVIKAHDGGKEHTVDFVQNLPFNMKGFHDDEPNLHPVGAQVEAGQVLTDNNYTKDGQLAIGKNLETAYMPFKGFNHEDGIVVSRSATEKLQSNHAYKVEYEMGKDTIADVNKYKAAFAGKFTAEQLSKLDSRGFAKQGAVLEYGDPVFAVLEQRQLTETDMVLGRLHKTLVNPYRSAAEVWDHKEKGTVTDTSVDGKKIRIMVRCERNLEIGDKVTGFHGNKGVVSAVLEDDEMPTSGTTGKPFDLILNPASVTSRINLGQIFEAAAGKIAQKTGQPYKTKVYEEGNTVKNLMAKLKEHGLSDTDTVIDPKTGHVYGTNVLTGPQYFLKLNKTTDANYSARSVGGYDNNAQPTKGGDDGAKAVGYMEFLGLLGSNARANLKEIGTVKSEGGDHSDTHDYWDKFMRGLPLPQPKTTFATRKFFDYLRGSGINVSERNGSLVAGPMTDREVLGNSSGEIHKPDMILARNVSPVKGGLFDMDVTGGPEGNNWSHYKLMEPIVNPVMEDPARALLGLSKEHMNHLISGKYGVIRRGKGLFDLVDTHKDDALVKQLTVSNTLEKAASEGGEALVGGHAIEAMLKDIHVDDELAHLRGKVMDEKSATKRDTIVKKMKYLAGLAKQGFTDPSKALVLHHMPVIPPVMRPYTISGNRLGYADVNELYKHHMLVNGRLKRLDDEIGMDMISPDMEGMVDLRRDLYNGAKAIMDGGDPIDYQAKQKGTKGLMRQLEGTGGPKTGYFQDKILKKKQDFSGRGTIYAAPDIGFNEARIPADQLWTMYKMHIIRDLSQKGYDLAEAKNAYEGRNDAATASFNHIVDTVPVMLNRAPTLMRTNIMAMKAVPTDGKTIGVNILHLPAFAADYDGDAMSMFVPMTPEAVREAKEKLMPSSNLHDARKGYGNPMFAPGHEAILGSVHLTKPNMDKKVVEFKTEAEALAALEAGHVQSDTPIRIMG